MSRPEESSEPTEETYEEPKHGSSLHDQVAVIGQELGVDKSLILRTDQIFDDRQVIPSWNKVLRGTG